MKICPECQTKFEDGNFCPNCGKYVPKEKKIIVKAVSEDKKVCEDDIKHNLPSVSKGKAPDDNKDTAIHDDKIKNGFSSDINFEKRETPSTWSFVFTIFISFIPVVGFFYLLFLAFGVSKYPSKVHFARAVFIFLFIVAVLASIIWIIFGRKLDFLIRFIL